MKVTVQQQALVSGLAAINGVVTGKTTLPVLSNVLLRADMKIGRLILTATDLDMYVSTEVEAMITAEGVLTVSAKKLTSLVKELNGEINMSGNDRAELSLLAGSGSFKLRGLAAEEFPPTPTVKGRTITLPQERLRQFIANTNYAQSKDESRYVLNGLYFEFKGGFLNVAATDGRRLALFKSEVAFEGETSFVVPSKAVGELGRICGDKGNVTITANENMAQFEFVNEANERTIFNTRLVEGTYPNYRQVIPSTSQQPIKVSLPREICLAAFRAAALMTSEKSNSIHLSFTKNQLTVRANSPDIGESKHVVDIAYKGKDAVIALNPDYVMEPFKAREDSDLLFCMSDELCPATLRAGDNFLYVVMPVRLADVPAPKKEEQPQPESTGTPAEPEPANETPKQKGKKNANKPQSTPTPEPEPVGAAK